LFALGETGAALRFFCGVVGGRPGLFIVSGNGSRAEKGEARGSQKRAKNRFCSDGGSLFSRAWSSGEGKNRASGLKKVERMYKDFVRKRRAARRPDSTGCIRDPDSTLRFREGFVSLSISLTGH
jgi:hypothetical protein